VKLEVVEMEAEEAVAPSIVTSPLSASAVEAEDEVDPLDAFMMSNTEQLLTETRVQETEEVDPLDAFMNAQVLPQFGSTVAGDPVKQESTMANGTGNHMNGKLPTLAVSCKKGPQQRRTGAHRRIGGRMLHSSDESSSDSEEEESSEEDDAVSLSLL
jgi:hypothetical protein